MRRSVLLVLLWLLALAGPSCNPRGWYRIDDYPSFTVRPILDFEESIEKPTAGAPPRMIKLNKQLNVSCSYCHVESDAVSCNLTTAGTTSRLMMDLADRFKVECTYCHAQSPSVFTRAGRFAQRDMNLPDRRWACASCHDVGFRVTSRRGR